MSDKITRGPDTRGCHRAIRKKETRRLAEKHDVPGAGFLLDTGGYLIALVARIGQLPRLRRNPLEKRFQSVLKGLLRDPDGGRYRGVVVL